MRAVVRVSGQVPIRRASQDVFAFVADGRNDPLWRGDIRHIEYITPEPVCRHSQYVERMEEWGVPMTAWYKVTEYEPNRLIAARSFRTSRPIMQMNIGIRRTVLQEKNYALFGYELDLIIDDSPLYRLIAPFLKYAAQQRLNHYLRQLQWRLDKENGR
ncbi:hypothetical protein [Paenibacillus chungangensis]|uniref:Polyketide cyclase n=1 Tax=Paenibacillus chungangensis TaxID=696535 RepID=A0ABW3HVY7_9BACL